MPQAAPDILIFIHSPMAALPSLFVSHGAPTLALEPGETGIGWRKIVDALPVPESILVISAHWDSTQAQLSLAESPATIHDFGGFPDALYRMRYPAPGAPALAKKAAALLNQAGIQAALHPDRGLDHGAWVPLQLMVPAANIRVTQLSLQTHLGPRHAHAVGQALKPLREDGVLILGSGGIVHNLRMLDWQGHGGTSQWAAEFNSWIEEHTLAGDLEALFDYRARAPHGARSHPTEEHLLPFFTALGAGGQAERIDLGFTFGSLGMDAWLFQ